MGSKVKLLVSALSLSATGVQLIQGHEGTVRKVYKDTASINTVCTGHVTNLPLGKVVPQSLCDTYLKGDTRIAQDAIKRLVKVPVTQEQYDAMTSLVFNIGGGAFAKSTLLKDINMQHCIAASGEWMRWNRAGGQVSPGLTNRRRDESNAWLTGC